MTDRTSGVVPPPGADPTVATTLRGNIGAANLQTRAVGVGTVKHLAPAGRLNACYSVVNLTNEDQNNINVPHSLAQVPSWCLLLEVTSAGGTVVAAASPVRKDQWTVTSCRMAMRFHVGGMSGSQGVFLVAGP